VRHPDKTGNPQLKQVFFSVRKKAVKEKILKITVLALALSALSGYVYYKHTSAQSQPQPQHVEIQTTASPLPQQRSTGITIEVEPILPDNPDHWYRYCVPGFDEFINYDQPVQTTVVDSSGQPITLFLSSKNITAPVFSLRVGHYLKKPRYQSSPRSPEKVLDLFDYQSHLTRPQESSPSR
jgi:hypothetical protein